MTEGELIAKINNIRVCKSGDKRAPHKPLLMLCALANIQKGSSRFLAYRDVEGKLISLLDEFGPSVKRQSPEQPFIRLYNDKIWDFDQSVNKIPDRAELFRKNVNAGFNNDVFQLLMDNNNLIERIVAKILENHFSDTLHDDILSRVGLRFSSISIRKVRDPNFREKVLSAYDNKCAICGFNVKLGNVPLAIEAAYIKWYKAGGPNKEENGIALCVMHHRLFDKGAFKLNPSKEVIVSKRITGTIGVHEWLMSFNGKRINLPVKPEYQSNKAYIDWHVREVYKQEYVSNM